MTRDQIRDCVLSSLAYLQNESEPNSVEILETTKPIPDLGFVSDDGVDFACELSAKAGFLVPEDVNPFVDDSGQRARSVGEIITFVFNLQPTTEATDG